MVAVAVVAGAAGVGAAASDGSITADPATPGETATHTVTVTVGDESTGSWNGLAVDYANASGADASDVGAADVAKIGIDRGDDADGDTIDTNVSDDLSSVSVSNEGTYLVAQLGGSYSVNATDEVVVVVDGVTNPEAGSYTLNLDVNPQSSGGETSAALEVTADDAGTAVRTATAGETVTETAAAGASPTETDGGGSGGVPGFGVGAALVAAAAGLGLAARRRV